MKANCNVFKQTNILILLIVYALWMSGCSSKQHMFLYQAVYNNDSAETSQLISKGYDPDIVINDDGWCPVIAAVYKDYLTILEIILNAGADPDAALKNGVTALHIAVEKDDAAFLDLLIRHHADVNSQTQNGVTPLYAATVKNNVKAMELLLEAGADVHVANKEGWTPLLAAAYSNYNEAVELLRRYGAQVTVHAHAALNDLSQVRQSVHTVDNANQKTAQNLTVLHFALKNGHMDMARFLIDRGARVDQASDERLYPIHLAASWNDTAMGDLLIKKGADIKVIQTNGLTPLHMAAARGHRAMIDFLLDRGAFIDATTQSGETPLYSASANNHPETVRILIAKGASIDVKHNGWTPLMVASSRGYTEIVRDLINVKNVRIDNEHEGATALYLASYGGHRDSAELLLNAGADLSKGYKGWTSLHGAARSGSLDTVRLLLDHGADVNGLISKTNLKPMDIAYNQLDDSQEVLTLLTGYYGYTRLANARRSMGRGDAQEALHILKDIQGYYDHHAQKYLRDMNRIQRKIKGQQLRNKLVSSLNISKSNIQESPENDPEMEQAHDNAIQDTIPVDPKTEARLKRKAVYKSLYELHSQRYKTMVDCLEQSGHGAHCLEDSP